MTRWVAPANATAAALPSIGMCVFAELDFADQTLYLHDGGGYIAWGGHTYTGIGDFASFESIDEDTEPVARSVILRLSGVPGAVLTEAMTQNYQGRQVILSTGIFDVNTMSFAATPEVLWEGRMDYMAVEINQNAASIKMYCESRLNREPAVARYTDVDQQLAFPGDSFFDLVWMIPNAQSGWGGVTAQYPANIPPTGQQSNVGPGGNRRPPGR